MSVMHPPSLADYQKLLLPHERSLQRLALDFKFFQSDVGHIDIFSVSARLKEHPRALRKSAGIGVPVSELDDLAGLRIVVGTTPEVAIIERFFSRQEDSKDLKILKCQRIERNTGYRATHLVVEARPSYQTSMFSGRVEVQIHTIFEHAFNFLSRSWSYRQSWEHSPEWSKRFTEVSGLLASLDRITAELHEEMVSATSDSDASPLTPHSFRQILRSEFQEDDSIQNCVDSCCMYIGLGCKTNAQMREFFRNSKIRELYDSIHVRAIANGSPGPLSQMSRSTFWSIFGTRVDAPGLKEFFERLPPDI